MSEESAQALKRWRALSAQEQRASLRERIGLPVEGTTVLIAEANPHMAAIRLVRACPSKGPADPRSGPCGCRWICLAGKGSPIPGTTETSVCLQDCLVCVAEVVPGSSSRSIDPSLDLDL